ncbi:MAG: 3-hydroxyacyl-CoA dehydrogenase NAD-binding domain-containing protein [Bacteroidales bacterium]
MNRIQKIGIIGSGKMGSDIFNYLSDYSYKLVWFNRNSEHSNMLHETFEKKLKRQLKHGIINQDIFELKNTFQITSKLNELSDCDLVIETVIEDQNVKLALFKSLENIVKPSCIIVSNSSSIIPSIYSQELNRQNRIAGIHFFYPMAIKNVTEIIYSNQTDEVIKECIKLFLESINRFYIEQDETNAFILNRFLLEMQIKAFDLHKLHNIDFKEIDEIAKKIIPDFGLFEVIDAVGHQTMYNSILNYSHMDVNKYKYNPLLADLDSKLKSGFNYIELTDSLYSTTIKIEIGLQENILNTLKNYSQEIIASYSANFNINIYVLKKALNDFCGIMV